jgi:thioredoxin reductase
MSRPHTDVTVVGAGAAGIGVGVALSKLDLDVRILDRTEIGASFRRWPDEMRFITPSFPSNSFGLTDLNAVTPDTSPAFTLDREHPSGDEYADYLESVADFYELPVETGVEVKGIHRRADSPAATAAAADGGTAVADSGGEGFVIKTTDGQQSTEQVVWAAGHFGQPRIDVIDGAEHCRHTSTVDSWQEHIDASPGDDFLVIGGYESGIDAAVGLHEAGASVQVLDRGWPWAERHPDPSEVLSPYTLTRLDEVADSDRLSVDGGTVVEGVHRTEAFRVDVRPADSETPVFVESTTVPDSYTVATRPLLATGFEPNLGPAEPLFSVDSGTVQLTDRDESTITPGVFLTGPDVVHNGILFCFIYKFRARFPVIAETIGERLGVDTDPLRVYREQNMFLDDLSCCEPEMCDC